MNTDMNPNTNLFITNYVVKNGCKGMAILSFLQYLIMMKMIFTIAEFTKNYYFCSVIHLIRYIGNNEELEDV